MKRQLRQDMKATLADLAVEVAADKSRRACAMLLALKEFREAGVVMTYLPIPGELDATPIVLAAWSAGKTVLAPKVDWPARRILPIPIRSLESGLVVGRHGIREPQGIHPWPVGGIDLVLVPALAYDHRGYRLGRGAGLYDRFLAEPGLRAATCGLAFGEQLLQELPAAAHDRPVDMLVTDAEVLRFGRQIPGGTDCPPGH